MKVDRRRDREQVGLLRSLSFVLVLSFVPALCVARAFSAEFLSGEDANAPLLALTRWLGNEGAKAWMPLWYGGTPFGLLGPLGMPWAASIVGKWLSWTPQHSFHWLAASTCCALPAVLFIVLRRVRMGRPAALFSALLYLLLPTGYAFLKEGAPHLLGALLAIIFLGLLNEALQRNRTWVILAAPPVFTALVLTDWAGAISVLVVAASYALSQSVQRLKKDAIAFAGVVSLGGLLAYQRVNFEALSLWRRNLLAVDSSLLAHNAFYGLTVLIASILILHYLFERSAEASPVRVLTYSTLIFSVIVFGSGYSAFRLVPHPELLRLDLSLVATPLLILLSMKLWTRLNLRARTLLTIALGGLAVYQLSSLIQNGQIVFRPNDVTETAQYRVSRWLDRHAGGRRLFATGETGLWLNVFSDSPQMTGCCDDWVPNQIYRTASWAIVTGQNAGDKELSNSLAWLRTFGVGFVIVDSSYWKPYKFDRILPKVFQEKDISVYQVPAGAATMAHVIAAKDAIRYVPESGLDLFTVKDYVESTGSETQRRCDFRWLDRDRARIAADVAPRQLVSIQANYDPRWRAAANGRPVTVRADAIGMILIDPQCSGPCSIDLTWAPVRQPIVREACVLVLLAAAIWWLRKAGKRWLSPALLVLAGSLLFVIIFRSAWVAEDAYISLRVTDNILSGYGPRWNIDERVQTYTDPLFSAFVTIAAWMVRDVYTASILVSLLFTLGAVILLFRGATPKGLVLGLLALFFSKGFIDFSVSGLENPATHLALAAYLFIYFRKRDPLLLSLCAAGAALNREDTVLLLLPSLALVYWSERHRVWKRALIGWAPFLLWLAFATYYYGFPFPNTAYAKLRPGIPVGEVFRQGVAYCLNAWHWDTGTIVTLVAGSLTACVVGQWAIAAGLLLNVLYVISVGGDYMTSRFLTAAFVVSVAVIARYWNMRLPDSAAAAAMIVCAGITIPSPAITSATEEFGQPWPVEPFSQVADERAYAYPCAGVLRRSKRQPPWPRHLVRPDNPYWYSCQGPPVSGSPQWIWPDAYLARIGSVWKAANVETFIIGNVGMAGYFAGPKMHIIDDMALGDAFLARLPMIPADRWVAGHYRRAVPAGYLETIQTGSNRIKDADLHEYYDHLHTVISGSLSDTHRLIEIVLFNAGRYDYLIDRYVRNSKKKRSTPSS